MSVTYGLLSLWELSNEPEPELFAIESRQTARRQHSSFAKSERKKAIFLPNDSLYGLKHEAF